MVTLEDIDCQVSASVEKEEHSQTIKGASSNEEQGFESIENTNTFDFTDIRQESIEVNEIHMDEKVEEVHLDTKSDEVHI